MTDPLGRSPRDSLFSWEKPGTMRATGQGYPQIPLRRPRPNKSDLDGTGRLLDLGCGTGQLDSPSPKHVAETVGMDPEPEMLAELTPQASGQPNITNVTWIQGNAADLPGEFGRFRLVTMGRSFHWMDRATSPRNPRSHRVEDSGGLVVANDSCLVRPVYRMAASHRGHPTSFPAAGLNTTDQRPDALINSAAIPPARGDPDPVIFRADTPTDMYKFDRPWTLEQINRIPQFDLTTATPTARRPTDRIRTSNHQMHCSRSSRPGSSPSQ